MIGSTLILSLSTVTQVASIAKMVSEEWRALSKEDKIAWEEEASSDRVRYNAEMKNYRNTIKEATGSEVPKRPMSAYLAFSNKRRAGLKRLNPSATNAELSKLLSKAWKEAAPELKSEYIQEEAKLRAEYNAEMLALRKTQAKVIITSKSNTKGSKGSSRKSLEKNLDLKNSEGSMPVPVTTYHPHAFGEYNTSNGGRHQLAVGSPYMNTTQDQLRYMHGSSNHSMMSDQYGPTGMGMHGVDHYRQLPQQHMMPDFQSQYLLSGIPMEQSTMSGYTLRPGGLSFYPASASGPGLMGSPQLNDNDLMLALGNGTSRFGGNY